MTIDRLDNICLIDLGVGPTELSEPELSVAHEELNEIVNNIISETRCGITDKVVQLETGHRTYHLDNEVQSIEDAILNDQYPIIDGLVPINKLLAG
jgi:hypothetical protein